ncbi:hypothetical protein [Liquorilactobacillus sicerae]|uniref:hypothetical protein n=1 Tax=Liquorilactobacillus sicerae TaxID=1416943 RepID=UPI00247FD26B|nr:hypothetical protein [Liquorilactobacillus sicerae]
MIQTIKIYIKSTIFWIATSFLLCGILIGSITYSAKINLLEFLFFTDSRHFSWIFLTSVVAIYSFFFSVYTNAKKYNIEIITKTKTQKLDALEEQSTLFLATSTSLTNLIYEVVGDSLYDFAEVKDEDKEMQKTISDKYNELRRLRECELLAFDQMNDAENVKNSMENYYDIVKSGMSSYKKCLRTIKNCEQTRDKKPLIINALFCKDPYNQSKYISKDGLRQYNDTIKNFNHSSYQARKIFRQNISEYLKKNWSEVTEEYKL